MKTKKINRYYCDFCKKSGCSAGHMSKHEQHCTMNPNRKCRVCDLIEEIQTDMAELLAVLPDVESYKTFNEDGDECYRGDLTDAAHAALPKLREVTNNCPACILAAIRQAGIPVPMVTDFNWTTEMEGVWNEFNAAQAD